MITRDIIIQRNAPFTSLIFVISTMRLILREGQTFQNREQQNAK